MRAHELSLRVCRVEFGVEDFGSGFDRAREKGRVRGSGCVWGNVEGFGFRVWVSWFAEYG